VVVTCIYAAAFDWVVAERLIHHADPFPFIIVKNSEAKEQGPRERKAGGWSAGRCACVSVCVQEEEDDDGNGVCFLRLRLDKAALYFFFLCSENC
jgi:hypothetical protein